MTKKEVERLNKVKTDLEKIKSKLSFLEKIFHDLVGDSSTNRKPRLKFDIKYFEKGDLN